MNHPDHAEIVGETDMSTSETPSKPATGLKPVLSVAESSASDAQHAATEALEELRRTRIEYLGIELSEELASVDPFVLWEQWLSDAIVAEIIEPHSMVLATVDASGRPRARNVLLRRVTDEGRFVFFTNYESQKGHDVASNENVCMLFSWLSLQRQVRINGRARPVDPALSDEYFASRPRDTQIGAWASPQSQPIGSRQQLADRVQELNEKFAGEASIPRPPHWGGYEVTPIEFEFWQGQPSRLHDRLHYWRQRGPENEVQWRRQRLAP